MIGASQLTLRSAVPQAHLWMPLHRVRKALEDTLSAPPDTEARGFLTREEPH